MRNLPSTSVIDQKLVRPYYYLSALTGFLLLLASLGSFVLKDIYTPFVPAHLIPEAYGQDLLSLLAVPALILSLRVASRNSLRGLVLLIGILLYVAYAYVLYAFGALYNVFFLVYVALVGLPIYAVIGLMSHIQGEVYRSHIKACFPEKLVSLYLMGVAILVAIVWMVFLVRAMSTQMLSEGINTVYVLDLALLLPAFMVAAIQLWRRKTWGYILSGILLVKAVTLGLSIVLGKVFAYMHNGTFNAGLVGLFGIMTLVGLAVLVAYLRNIQDNL
jgi:NADH:ubiquinone oxidoreductase subunit 6 (subunit J)